jgi:MoaA/NifB/PqqE/SkfB family radical SAM enzyme
MRELRLVEIELFNYCNRKCKWCPNSFIDRKSNFKEIENDILHSLIKELKQCKYNGPITFSRYNEPLSRPQILNKRIKQIKGYLLKNKIITNIGNC